MKKFREFVVKTHGIKALAKALVKHASHLGYEFDEDFYKCDVYNILCFDSYGDCVLYDRSENNEITLDEFFALEPEVEPERFDCCFTIPRDDLIYDLTQDQIDRITAIMKENDSPVRSVS